jgi:hypothetical protein
MYLKKLTEKRLITIDYYENGALKTSKGRVYSLNPIEQVLSLIDNKKKSFSIRFSNIKHIY